MLNLLLFLVTIVGGILALPPLSPTISPIKEVTVNVVTRKWTHLLNEKFLSFTLQPHIALEFQDYDPSTLSMFKSLSPAMVRLGGPEIDHVAYLTSGINTDYTLSEEQWKRLNKFTDWAKLNLIVCLNPMERLHGVWQSKGALEFIDASDKLGYDLQWELGYELQRLRNMTVPLTGNELGRDVVRLRKILDSFPRYAKSAIIGPDVVDVSNVDDMRFVKEFLNESGDALTVFTWHPQFAKSDREKEDISFTLTQILRQVESLLPLKDPLRLATGKPMAKKEVWISESDPDESTGNFSDALTWIKRLGTAAMLGFPVYMKQISRNSIGQPTHDFWVSVLYKSLVGRAVLEAKMVAGDKNMSHVFAHCTEMSTNNIVESDFEYERGAVTVFGLNLANEEIKLNIKASFKDEPVHMYILTAENKNNKQETYLNGQLLRLSPMSQMPVILPKVKNATRNLQVDIPPRSVYFLVLPEIKAKQCMMYPIVETPVNGVDNADHHLNSLMHFDEDTTHEDNDEPHVYVRFGPKKKKTGNKEDSENKQGDNEIVTDKLLRLKFPIPEAEITENKELDRSPKSIRDLNSEGKNKISKASFKDMKLVDKMKNQKKEKNVKNNEEKVEDTVKLNNSDNELSEAMMKTKFIMFSDDDWLSNFSHAKKAVEAAKKIIEAFDEAELLKKKECEKQSAVLKVENDKYHIQYGKDGQRKKKFAVLSTSISESDNDTNHILSTQTEPTSSAQLLTTPSTGDESSDTIQRAPGKITDCTTQSSADLEPIHTTPDVLLSQEQRQKRELDNEFQKAQKHATSSILEKRVKRELQRDSSKHKSESSDLNKNSHITKIQNKKGKRKVRRSVMNDQLSENLEMKVKFKDDLSIEEPLPDNKISRDCRNADIQIGPGKRLSPEGSTVMDELVEGKIDSEAYHPGEFYEHRNLQKIDVNKNHDFQDIFEAESPSRGTEDDVHDELPNDMKIVREMCKNSEHDKSIKDKVEADLKQYYENAEKMTNENAEQNDDDGHLRYRQDNRNTFLSPDDQRVKRKSEVEPKIDSVRMISGNQRSVLSEVEIKNQNSSSKPETKMTDKPMNEKPREETLQKISLSGLEQVQSKDATNKIYPVPVHVNAKEVVGVNLTDLKPVTEEIAKEKLDKINENINVLKNNRINDSSSGTVKTLNAESQNNANVGKPKSGILTSDLNQSKLPQANKEKLSAEFNLETEDSIKDKTRMARDNQDLKKQEIQYEENGKILERNKPFIGNDRNVLNNINPIVPYDDTVLDVQNERNAPLNLPSEKIIDNGDVSLKAPSTIPSDEKKFNVDLTVPKNSDISEDEKAGEGEENHNLDIVCGRTKNFGTFCVGSERKLPDDNLEYKYTKKDPNLLELQDIQSGSSWKGKSDETQGRETRIHEESMKSSEGKANTNFQDGASTCKASKAAPYVEDFEELLSQINELRNNPGNARHRRLVHFTVPAVSMKRVDDKDELPSYLRTMELEESNYKAYDSSDVVADHKDRGYDQNSRSRYYYNDRVMKERNNSTGHKNNGDSLPMNNAEDNLMHDLHHGFDDDGFDDDVKKEQIKRTVITAPRIRSKHRPFRNDLNFGSEVFYQETESDPERSFAVSKKSKHRNAMNEDQRHLNSYKEPHSRQRYREPIARDEFNDYSGDDSSDLYYQRNSQSAKSIGRDTEVNNYRGRYYNNDDERRESAFHESEIEKGYVRLPGDVYSEMEGARAPTQSREPHFVKSTPVQVNSVPPTSPDMYRPKLSRTASQRAKRSSVPYFRDVQNDIAAMKKAVDSSEFTHHKNNIHQPYPKTSTYQTLKSKPYSQKWYNGLNTRNIDKTIKYRFKRSDPDLHKAGFENTINGKADELHRSNEVLQMKDVEVDAFDDELLREKTRQFELLKKKLTDLAKLYAREKSMINDGLTNIVNEKTDEIVDILKNDTKLVVSELGEMASAATKDEDGNKLKPEVITTTTADESTTPRIVTVNASRSPSQRNAFTFVVNQMRNLVHFIMQGLTQI